MQMYAITAATAATDMAASAAIIAAAALPSWGYKQRLYEERGGRFAYWAGWYMVLWICTSQLPGLAATVGCGVTGEGLWIGLGDIDTVGIGECVIVTLVT